MRIWAMIALAVTAVPAAAQDKGWKTSRDSVAVPSASVRLPLKVGTLTLVKADEFSRMGEGLDNYAQYESADRLVFATAYVYRPAMADASLAAYATDRAVRQRFGSGVKIAEQSSIAIDGRPGTGIRTIYTGAQLEPGKPLVTTAVFATVGGWTVKLRASGPADRQAEVVAALDALVAGMKVDRKATLSTTRPLAFDPACPPAATTEAKLLPEKGMGADALLGMMLGGAVQSVTQPGETARPQFPSEGAMRACVRGTIRVGQASADLIQPAGTATPDTVLAALSDSGTVLAIKRSAFDDGYAIKVHSIGQVDTLGQVDAQPTPAQLQGWLSDPKSPFMALRSRSIIDASGKQRLQMPGGGTIEAKIKK